MSEPLACRLDALDSAERERHAQLFRELAASVADVEELPDGLAIRFPSKPYVFLRLAEWMELERACCPFLEFGLIFENRVPTMRLELRGPEGVKDFLRAELPFAPQPASP
ncbi:MAG TPA: hypothetical protein VLE54_04590 [Thermoanaerobaculia bacterium]|nr:hypothetical protein [Thermoanaerobaculia bacterium]